MDNKVGEISSNRRNLLKSGLFAMGASALALFGCNKEKEEQPSAINNDELNIVPKQTGTYEFSCALPYNYKTIDEIVKLNTTLKKSRIVTLYNNTPLPLASRFNQWVQIARGKNENIKSYDDFAKYVKYAKDKGFNFTYLLNSSKPFSEKDFLTFKDDFLYLLDYLKKIGCNDIKIGNTQVAELINKYAPNEFNLSASTSFEFHNILQYESLFSIYPNFNLIDMPYEENQNFRFLKTLKTRFPKIKLELMANESCIKGCPSRIAHMSEYYFCKFNCHKIEDELGLMASTFRRSTIYPWDLEYYSAIGINNFKFVAYGFKNEPSNNRNNFHNIKTIKKYLEIVENYDEKMPASNILETGIFMFSENTKKVMQDMTLADLREYMPDIRYFIKNGDKCYTRCGIDCKYCYSCANRLQKFLLYGKENA